MDAISYLEQLGANPHAAMSDEDGADATREAVRDRLEAAGRAMLSERAEAPVVFSCLIMTPDGEEGEDESPSENEDDDERGDRESR
ncbi:hypothetical protein [Luteimonas abyssi]|uniref:hypothetical protein n=1 Tax=Luteimonas abyssi TaxID=1247514 RepID=UPI000737CDE3|nr:hypothetical protein [Luteimonas abyssi]